MDDIAPAEIEDIDVTIKPANIARPDTKTRRPVVGTPVISVKMGYHCYHGLCDMGASASVIHYDLYKEIMHDIAPIELKTLMLLLSLLIGIPLNLLGLLEMLKFCVERLNTLLIFLFLAPHKMIFVPLFLVDPS